MDERKKEGRKDGRANGRSEKGEDKLSHRRKDFRGRGEAKERGVEGREVIEIKYGIGRISREKYINKISEKL